MRMLWLAMLALMPAIPAQAAPSDPFCLRLEGAQVQSSRGEPLGRIVTPYAPDSIFNRLGRFGSKLQRDSIWSDFGPNGSPYSPRSARNRLAIDPPLIVARGRRIGRLTANRALPGAVDPGLLGLFCYGALPSD